jgi:CysZ protein
MAEQRTTIIEQRPSRTDLRPTMPILPDLKLGFNGYLAAFGFAMRNGLGWVFLIPALLWVVLFYGLFALLEGPADQLSDRLAALLSLPDDSGSDATSAWNTVLVFVQGAWELFTLILLRVAIAYVLYKVNKYLVLILLSPLLAYVSERTEEILTGNTFPFSWAQVLKDAFRGSLIALRNGSLELLLSIGIWAITLLVPLVAPISFILLFTLSSYFYGFSMFDYVFERRRMRIGDSVRAVNDRVGAVVSNGALFSLLMKIPLFGVMLGPPLGAIGASISMVHAEGTALRKH